jgi:hypothetical protein
VESDENEITEISDEDDDFQSPPPPSGKSAASTHNEGQTTLNFVATGQAKRRKRGLHTIVL